MGVGNCVILVAIFSGLWLNHVGSMRIERMEESKNKVDSLVSVSEGDEHAWNGNREKRRANSGPSTVGLDNTTGSNQTTTQSYAVTASDNSSTTDAISSTWTSPGSDSDTTEGQTDQPSSTASSIASSSTQVVTDSTPATTELTSTSTGIISTTEKDSQEETTVDTTATATPTTVTPKSDPTTSPTSTKRPKKTKSSRHKKTPKPSTTPTSTSQSESESDEETTLVVTSVTTAPTTPTPTTDATTVSTSTKPPKAIKPRRTTTPKPFTTPTSTTQSESESDEETDATTETTPETSTSASTKRSRRTTTPKPPTTPKSDSESESDEKTNQPVTTQTSSQSPPPPTVQPDVNVTSNGSISNSSEIQLPFDLDQRRLPEELEDDESYENGTLPDGQDPRGLPEGVQNRDKSGDSSSDDTDESGDRKTCPWSRWGRWSKCDCRSGIRERTRKLKLKPRNCKIVGCGRQMKVCPVTKCPIDCIYSQWTSWSECNARRCGAGVRKRTRFVKVPALYGGKPCKRFVEKETCEVFDEGCAPGCQYTDWSVCYPQEPCGECGPHGGHNVLGYQLRQAVPVFPGGYGCPEPQQTQPCYTQCCQDYVPYGPNQVIGMGNY